MQRALLLAVKWNQVRALNGPEWPWMALDGPGWPWTTIECLGVPRSASDELRLLHSPLPQPDFARRMLMELPSTEDYSRPLRKMLQHALEYQNTEIVKLLLERPGSKIDQVR